MLNVDIARSISGAHPEELKRIQEIEQAINDAAFAGLWSVNVKRESMPYSVRYHFGKLGFCVAKLLNKDYSVPWEHGLTPTND